MEYVVAALIAGAVSIAGFLFGRRKNEADAANILTKIALSLVAPLEEQQVRDRARIAELETGYEELKRENAALHRWSQILFAQVIENGGTPLPFDAVTMLGGTDGDTD